MAHQPKTTHVQDYNEQNWNDQYQVGHICYHPKQIKIHLKQENNIVTTMIIMISINLVVVYHESVNLIGYITRGLSADSQQL